MEREFVFISDDTRNYLTSFLTTKKSKRTKEEYRNNIILLCEKTLKKDFLDITEEDAGTLLHNMNEKIYEGKLTYKTVGFRLTVYNSFANFIQTVYPELEYINPFRNLERPVIVDKVSPARVPSLSEMDRILSVAKSDPMYYLIIALTARCGLTATNIVRLTKNSIFTENNKWGLYVPHPDNENKTLAIMLPEDVTKLLKGYLCTLRYEDGQQHLFYNKSGNAISLKNLSDNIGEIVRAANLEFHYTLKDMRTRAILDLIEAGADDETIQQYMGLGPMRTRQFFEAKGMATGCPVDLVNYSLKIS